MTYEQTIYTNNVQLLLLLGAVVMLGIGLSLLIDFVKYKKIKRELNEKQNSSDSSTEDRN